MEIKDGEEHSQLAYQEKKYSFCSESCEAVFKKLNGIKLAGEAGLGDIERKMVAYNTLKQLAVTVAHYIRNANAAISLQAELCRGTTDPALHKSVEMIKHQSDKIETVVNSLLSISDIKLQKYTGSEEEAIFDLRLLLENKIKEG
ncbi:MAG: histidine kinase dimerization/phospho-acceptor domain-containing protein [Candidatus Margulisiibacteriota bacterium]